MKFTSLQSRQPECRVGGASLLGRAIRRAAETDRHLAVAAAYSTTSPSEQRSQQLDEEPNTSKTNELARKSKQADDAGCGSDSGVVSAGVCFYDTVIPIITGSRILYLKWHPSTAHTSCRCRVTKFVLYSVLSYPFVILTLSTLLSFAHSLREQLRFLVFCWVYPSLLSVTWSVDVVLASSLG